MERMQFPQFICFALSTLILSVIGFVNFSDSEEQEMTTKVHVAEIGRSVELIGDFGKPLGTKIAVTGVWKREPLDEYVMFAVKTVDGKALKTPREYSIGQMKVFLRSKDQPAGTVPTYIDAFPSREELPKMIGEEWELIVYERGFTHIPPEEYEEEDRIFPVLSYPNYYRHFTTELVGVVVKRPSTKH